MKTFGRFITVTLLILFLYPAAASAEEKKKKEPKAHFWSSLKDAAFKRDVTDGFVIPYDADGNPLDTIKATSTRWSRDGEIVTSDFGLPVSYGDTLVVFDAGAPGYRTETVSWSFKPFGKREVSRNMPPIYLSKVRELKEVTVTASKIKFYNKGDTIVYDADAFQLAEGSMLDALISQLPGAKIDENGQITVNGEFVESLLLNGKNLFGDDNKLMIDNIPAYTVKSVEVYKGHTKEEKFNFDQTKPRHLTMDVRLKKEYSHGWLLNFQGGYGTSDRYLGRLFASWFSPTTSVILTGATNNLNDQRTPGKDDSWTPETMPSGSQSHREAGIKYRYESADERVSADGSVNVAGNSMDYSNSTSATRFLTGGDSYERRFNDTKSSRFSVSTWHSASYTTAVQHRLGLSMSADYSRSDNFSNSLSGTFNRDYSDISRQTLDAIYADGSLEELGAIINRAKNRDEGSLRSGSLRLSPTVSFHVPNTNDRINLTVSGFYVTSKRHNWNEYNINYGNDPNPAERRLQYTDESPNYNRGITTRLGYTGRSHNFFFSTSYKYEFTDKAKDSYMYALDRLEDMGVFGVLPENYTSTLDPTNSYTSATLTNSHTLEMTFQWYKITEKYQLMLMAMPNIGVDHHRLDYWRENRSYLVKRTSFIMPQNYHTAWLEYAFGKSPDSDGYSFNHRLSYTIGLQTEGPELLHLVDVINDSDPLNIQEGNPHLKNSLSQNHSLRWVYSPFGKPLNNYLTLTYNNVTNSLVRGYTYDTATGIRRFRTYNVDGNYSLGASDYLNWEFGRQKQFILTSSTNCNSSNNTDMVGVNADMPEKAQVKNLTLSENLMLSYKIGKQQLSLSATVTHRHSSSERQDFNTINAQHYKYGVRGIFELPAGFGISTDFNIYKRVGYGVKELDTTDAVWNMRLSYTPKGSKHWSFMADGFDLLHRLSNVHYSVTATGRTVTYTNTLPRYFLITAQYRLNIQPKK